MGESSSRSLSELTIPAVDVEYALWIGPDCILQCFDEGGEDPIDLFIGLHPGISWMLGEDFVSEPVRLILEERGMQPHYGLIAHESQQMFETCAVFLLRSSLGKFYKQFRFGLR